MDVTRKILTAGLMGGLGCALLGLGAGSAHAQQEGLWERVRSSYDPASVARIEAAAQGAAAAAVPVELILEKALEGAAKGVPAALVVPAVEDYGLRLGQAAGLMPPGRPRAALVSGAEALRRGVPAGVVREVAQGQGDAAPAALVVLAELVEAGGPVEQALQAVREALARGHGPDGLLDLPAVVRRRIREGNAPGEAARGAAAALGQGRGRPPVPPGTDGTPGKSGGKGQGGA